MLKYLLAVSGLTLILACQHVQNSSHDHGSGSHSHGEESDHDHAEPAALSFTEWKGSFELFVEFKPLVVGEVSSFAAHFTRLSDYKPVEAGTLTVSLVVGDRGIRQAVEVSSSPGIFNPALKPVAAGEGQLIFELNTAREVERVVLDKIRVYADASEALADSEEDAESGDAVNFLKEQAWKIDFAIARVTKKPISEVIHTSGQILPIKGQEKLLSARSNGIVLFGDPGLREGMAVRSGEKLLTINSQGLLDANLEERYRIATARLEKAEADFERAKKLIGDKIIGEKEFERRKMEFSIAEAEYQTLTQTYSSGGQVVSTPMSGIIKNILVSDGQFVEEGAPLLKITNNRRLVLQADVSQRHLSRIEQVRSANFKTPFQDEVQSISDYNGKLVSVGKLLDEKSSFVPVKFELDNKGDLIPGAFAELYLLADPDEKALVVPKSAIMQDYSVTYVYVEMAGESFEKRPVRLGVYDGFNVQVLSGLSEGDWVVTKGAYQIKMASMSSTIPAHGHTH